VSWQSILRTNFTSVEALADFLELGAEERNRLVIKPEFRLNLPKRLADKLPKGTLDHPLTRQFIPQNEELNRAAGFAADPVQDARFQRTARLLHKYEGRMLMVTTGACAMHCRYCFRQNYEYESSSFPLQELRLLADSADISEIILSGGDPLSLQDSALERILQAINDIPHVKRVRFHTRFPIGIPERICSSLLDILSRSRAQIWFVIHCNHVLELDSEVCAALKRIQCLGIPVLNQAVLLRGVNDSLDDQLALCNALVDHGVQPYYLHQLDRVLGAQHFEVPAGEGLTLIEKMRARLSGYAVPSYVQELAGDLSKTPVSHTVQIFETQQVQPGCQDSGCGTNHS
jgi:EF-P beta-lysylation protein EpmB